MTDQCDKAGDSTAVRVHYSGRVQGVGFRATTAEIARSFPVTGWVRNIPDGRVELWVEGNPAALKQFLDAVRQYWSSYLTDEQQEQVPPAGPFDGFEIRL